ncbi:hypothetical protein CH380_03820 [Leptospira adleri]|uniref:Uncharacterized protein n=1 Tax=Leptospira adleri TaxID=2023186 RepID=A0A2M9YTI6_9LEPT|nr:hypothetical protein CH380_03820 [Leptospira adleri]PJZ61975.1 hypothetical protein CH376_10530 [Leptospira adleri]
MAKDRFFDKETSSDAFSNTVLKNLTLDDFPRAKVTPDVPFPKARSQSSEDWNLSKNLSQQRTNLYKTKKHRFQTLEPLGNDTFVFLKTAL